MKKTNVILSAVALCGAFASTSFAGTITGSTTIGGGTYSPSAKVGINLVSAAAAYGATSAHLNGTYEYGTVGGTVAAGNDPTKILSKAFTTPATNTVGVPEAPTAGALPSGTWN